jgi:PAS domain S-box-containing protein
MMGTEGLKALYDSDALAIGCWSADGRFTAANQALLDLLGCTQWEIKNGRIGWPDITPAEYAPLDAQALEEIRQKGFCSPFQKEYIRKDGRRVPVLIGAVAFGGGVVDAGTFYAVNLSGRKTLHIATTPDAPPETYTLTDRQRLVCLLVSHGASNKSMAYLLDAALRTVELDKQRIAQQLELTTAQVRIWAVENRKALLATIKDPGSVPDAVASKIGLSK